MTDIVDLLPKYVSPKHLSDYTCIKCQGKTICIFWDKQNKKVVLVFPPDEFAWSNKAKKKDISKIVKDFTSKRFKSAYKKWEFSS